MYGAFYLEVSLCIMLLRGRGCRELYFCIAVLLLSLSVHSQEEKFAGNLSPASGGGDENTGNPELGSNQTAQPDEGTRIVHSSQANPVQQEGESTPKVPMDGKQSVKKAPRPLGKPESVGFVPPLDAEESEHEEEMIEKVKEKQVVTLIPTLPARLVL